MIRYDIQWELTNNENLTDEEKEELEKLWATVNAEDTKTHSFMSKCALNTDNTTYTCPGSNATFQSATFTSDCVTLGNGEESCPKKAGNTVVASVASVATIEEAEAACTAIPGTHLATSGEISQLWNNHATGLDFMACSSAWTSDGDNEFYLRASGRGACFMMAYIYKPAICVGN